MAGLYRVGKLVRWRSLGWGWIGVRIKRIHGGQQTPTGTIVNQLFCVSFRLGSLNTGCYTLSLSVSNTDLGLWIAEGESSMPGFASARMESVLADVT